jgi:hypothetical protein
MIMSVLGIGLFLAGMLLLLTTMRRLKSETFISDDVRDIRLTLPVIIISLLLIGGLILLRLIENTFNIEILTLSTEVNRLIVGLYVFANGLGWALIYNRS